MFSFMEKFRKARRNKKGFTLIELIVVIAILGILALIAIPRFTGLRADANEKAAIANLSNIQKAAEIYAIEENVPLTSVDMAAILSVLNVTQAELDGNPNGAVYSWSAPYAEVSNIAVPGDLGAAFGYDDI